MIAKLDFECVQQLYIRKKETKGGRKRSSGCYTEGNFKGLGIKKKKKTFQWMDLRVDCMYEYTSSLKKNLKLS